MEGAIYSHKNNDDFIFIIIIDQNIFSSTDFTTVSFDEFYSFFCSKYMYPAKIPNYYYINMYMHTYVSFPQTTLWIARKEVLLFAWFFVETLEPWNKQEKRSK